MGIAVREPMLLKKAVSAAVPAMVAVIAFLHAQAIGALVDATATPASIAPFAEARAATVTDFPAPRPTSGQVILDRNPFDHLGIPVAPTDGAAADVFNGDVRNVPECEGVRTIITVRAEEPDASFAALEVGGKRHLRRRGGEVDNLSVLFIAEDRVWISKNGSICQAKLFGAAPPPAAAAKPAAGAPSALEKSIGAKIQKTGPNEYAIDRGAVSQLLEAQTELMKTPLVPEKEGDRVVGYRMTRIKPGSVLSMLGLEAGDRLESLDGVAVTSAEGMMQAYARLSTGTLSHMTIHVNRGGKPLNLDYVIK